MSLPNIKISGYYGMRNYGDDLFAILSLRAMEKYFNVNNCSILSPPIIKSNYKLNYSNIKSFNSERYLESSMYGKIYRFMNYLHATFNTDYMIFSGGSLFSNAGISNRDILYKINFSRYKFHALGVSVGPFKDKNAEEKIKEYLKKYEYISLRDKKSYNIVKSYNLDAKVILAGDIAGVGVEFLTSINKDNEKKVKKIKIGFSPCNILGDYESSIKYIEHFLKNIMRIRKKIDFVVDILCLNENPYSGDKDLCKFVYERLNLNNIDCSIINYGDIGVEGTWEKISNYDYYVSVRLHGAITAYLVDTDFFLYEYHEKCTEFLKLINKEISDPDYYEDNFYIENHFFKKNLDKNSILEIKNYLNFSKENFLNSPLYNGVSK